MIQRILLLLLLAALFGAGLRAQTNEKTGAWYSDACMDTSASGDVIIHNLNSSGVGYTTLFLLRLSLPGETEDWHDGDFSLKRVATFEELDFLSPD